MKNSTISVLILGAECTGKSTLAQALADYYQTSFVPEYMRTYLSKRPIEHRCTWDDLTPIAIGQLQSEIQAIKNANRYCFIDTSFLLLDIYSRYYFGDSPTCIKEQLNRHYDIILLTDELGIEWVADGLRDLPNGRGQMRQKIIEQLNRHQLSYYVISGDLKTRMLQVHQILQQFDQSRQ